MERVCVGPAKQLLHLVFQNFLDTEMHVYAPKMHSYGPMTKTEILVELIGIEPTTSSLRTTRSPN